MTEKTVIIADLHIDENYYLDDTYSILNYIKEMVRSEYPVSYLFILGDVFNRKRPTPRELRVFNRWLMKIRPLVVGEIVILEGNHDRDNELSSLSYLTDLPVDKVTIAKPPFKFDKFYLGHEQIAGAVADNGVVLEAGSSLSQIIKNNSDYEVFAFGHFHKPQILNSDPLAFYAGSINKMSFSERDDVKNIWVFNDTTLVRRHEIPTRTMVQFDILETGDEYINPWKGLVLEGALVKLVYSGSKKALQEVNQSNLRDLFFNNKKVRGLKIVFNVTDKNAARNDKLTETISDEAALREYFKGRVDVNNIVELGAKLISEVTNGQ